MMMQRTAAHTTHCCRAKYFALLAGFSEHFMITPSSGLWEGKSHKRIFKVLTPRIARLPELPRSGKRGPDEFVY